MDLEAKKISELPVAPNIANDDVFPIVHSNTTSKAFMYSLWKWILNKAQSSVTPTIVSTDGLFVLNDDGLEKIDYGDLAENLVQTITHSGLAGSTQSVYDAINQLNTKAGDLSQLTTVDKSNLVAAINGLKNRFTVSGTTLTIS